MEYIFSQYESYAYYESTEKDEFNSLYLFEVILKQSKKLLK